MRLRWLALAWILGILVTDFVCHYLGIYHPINQQQVITAAILPHPMPTATLHSWLHTGLLSLAGIGGIAAIAIAVWMRRLPPTSTPKSLATLMTICLCFTSGALGGLRYQASLAPTTPQSIWLLTGTGDIMVQGSIVEDPRRTADGQQLVLATQAAQYEGKVAAVEGLLLVNLPPYPSYHYGDQIIVQGAIREPKPPRREGTFDYRAYLARQHIFGIMQEPSTVTLLDGKQGNPILIALLAFRDHCRAILLRELPEPQASIAIGILLGLKTAIPKSVYTTFSTVGTAHLLVISGWHLAIVASVFAGVSKRLHMNQRTMFWVLIAAIWLYTLFVGMSDSVMRAAVMASLTVLAQTTQRKTEPWTLLLTACLVLTLINPQTLWSLGFQMSVLATVSLFAFAQPMNERLQQWFHTEQLQRAYGIPIQWLIEPLAITLAAQVFVLPLILYHFGQLSLVAPLANMLLVPVLPYAMLAGALALGVGLVWLPAGQVVAAIFAWLPLAWLTTGASLLAGLPFAAITLPRFPLWLLLSYYVVVGWWWWEKQKYQRILRQQQNRKKPTRAGQVPAKPRRSRL